MHMYNFYKNRNSHTQEIILAATGKAGGPVRGYV